MRYLLHFEAMEVDAQRNSEDARTAGCSNLPDIGRALHNTVK